VDINLILKTILYGEQTAKRAGIILSCLKQTLVNNPFIDMFYFHLYLYYHYITTI